MNEDILNNLRIELQELADIGLQEKAWLGKIPNYISSYTELLCGLFDDSAVKWHFQRLLNSGETVPVELYELRLLLEKVSAYEPRDKLNDLEILRDPEWKSLSEQAKEVMAHWPIIEKEFRKLF